MSDQIDQLVTEYREWVERVQDTHDAVRYTYGSRQADSAFADGVSVYVVVEMLKKPGVFRYQGLPYAARIGSLAGPFLNRQENQENDVSVASSVSWDKVKQYLRDCPRSLQAAIVCAFVHGDTDEGISAAVGCTADEAAQLRSKALKYLENVDRGGAHGKSLGIIG